MRICIPVYEDLGLLLDIKPYVPDFDAYPGSKAGWFDAAGENRIVADERFHHPTQVRITDARLRI